MSEEGKDEGGQTPEVEEVQPDEKGNYPETVPWSKYVGIKESLGQKLNTEREKVRSLEEQLSKAVNQEEYTKVQNELEKVKNEHQQAQEKLKGIEEKSVGDKKEYLKSKGVPEEQYSEASVETLDAMIKVVDSFKPKPDMGSGGGTSAENLSAREKMIRGFEQSNRK